MRRISSVLNHHQNIDLVCVRTQKSTINLNLILRNQERGDGDDEGPNKCVIGDLNLPDYNPRALKLCEAEHHSFRSSPQMEGAVVALPTGISTAFPSIKTWKMCCRKTNWSCQYFQTYCVFQTSLAKQRGR